MLIFPFYGEGGHLKTPKKNPRTSPNPFKKNDYPYPIGSNDVSLPTPPTPETVCNGFVDVFGALWVLVGTLKCVYLIFLPLTYFFFKGNSV